MPLIQIVLLLIIAGVVLWLINQYVPMAASIKSILNAVVVVAAIIWLLNVFGLLSTTLKFTLVKYRGGITPQMRLRQKYIQDT